MFSSERRRWLADKLGDLAIYTITALLINQFVNQSFRLDLTIEGVLLSSLVFVVGYFTLQK